MSEVKESVKSTIKGKPSTTRYYKRQEFGTMRYYAVEGPTTIHVNSGYLLINQIDSFHNHGMERITEKEFKEAFVDTFIRMGGEKYILP